jgi:D-alanyl-D-alanine carboxypeptidase
MKKVPAGSKSIIIVPVSVIVLIVAGCSPGESGHTDLSPAVKRSKLEDLVSEFPAKTKVVKSCVLAVAKGDGSFSWSGAAGISNQDTRVKMTRDTPIFLSSITKLYTATVVMKLSEMAKLSLDDPMSRYLPTDLTRGIQVYEGRDYSNEITIKQLLSHSSGIADYYTEKAKDGKSLFEEFLEDPGRSWTVDETIARSRDELEPHFRPGTGTFYSDANYQLLGKIIENITGEPLHSVYEELIFQPLGLKHTCLTGSPEPQAGQAAPADIYYNNSVITRIRSNGAYWADGGIVSTADEMITFLRALNEGKIIRKGTLELMHDWYKMEFPLQYGYGTMYFKLPRLMAGMSGLTPLWGHSGSTGSFLYYSEDLDLYIAGSINVVGQDKKPFMLIRNVMKLFK